MEASEASEVVGQERIPEPPGVADPGPLGLACFGITTLALSLINAKLVGAASEPVVFALALMVGGLGQLIAGIFELRNGNTFGGVAFTAYAGFWLSFWAITQFYLTKIPEAEVGHALGLYLWCWAIFTVYMMVITFRLNGALALTFVLLVVTFVLLAIGNSGANEDTVKLGGYFGIVTAAMALYTSFAGVSAATFGKPLVPVFPLGKK